MKTIPVYTDYLKTMECVKVEIDSQHYVVFRPKSKVVHVTEDSKVKEYLENYIEVEIVDETISGYSTIFEAKIDDVNQLVRLIQDLVRQVKSMPSGLLNDKGEVEHSIIKSVSPCTTF